MANSVKLVNIPVDEWASAVFIAGRFSREYPNRMGIRDGVIYATPNPTDATIYVYRTKTQIVVRPTSEPREQSII